jgi:hypothetical protein
MNFVKPALYQEVAEGSILLRYLHNRCQRSHHLATAPNCRCCDKPLVTAVRVSSWASLIGVMVLLVKALFSGEHFASGCDAAI